MSAWGHEAVIHLKVKLTSHVIAIIYNNDTYLFNRYLFDKN